MAMPRHALIAVMSVAALGAAVVVALGAARSLAPNARQASESWFTCDLSTLAPGATQACGRALVYRRTEEDKRLVDGFTALLEDPGSTHSRQPQALRNKWRSASEDFLVVIPWSPNRGCEATFHAGSDGWSTDYLPEAVARAGTSFFQDRCEFRTWDTSGRLYYRPHQLEEYNLTVPPTRWPSSMQVQVYSGDFLKELDREAVRDVD